MVALCALVIGAVGFAIPVGAQTDAGSSSAVSGIATAGGMSAIFEVPQFLPLGDRLVEMGVPVAQALLETGGGAAQGYAAMPYPGDLLLSLPGTGVGLLGGLGGIPAPQYPLYVSADNANPERRFADPSGQIVLEARSTPVRVDGVAAITNPGAQPSAGKAISTARVVEEPGGAVLAIAETRVEGFALQVSDVVVQLGTVRSRSETVLDRGEAQPDTTKTFDITGASVNGIGIVIDKEGVRLGDQALPLPQQPLLDVVNDLLAGAAITMRVVDSDDTPGGSSGQYLEIATTQPLPVPGEPKGTVLYRVGRVETSVVAGVGAGAGGGVPPFVVEDGAVPSPTGAGAQSGPASAEGATQSNVAAGQTTPRSGVLGVEQSVLARNLTRTVRFFYGVLIVAGLAGVASATAWRSKGVRARWMP